MLMTKEVYNNPFPNIKCKGFFCYGAYILKDNFYANYEEENILHHQHLQK